MLACELHSDEFRLSKKHLNYTHTREVSGCLLSAKQTREERLRSRKLIPLPGQLNRDSARSYCPAENGEATKGHQPLRQWHIEPSSGFCWLWLSWIYHEKEGGLSLLSLLTRPVRELQCERRAPLLNLSPLGHPRGLRTVRTGIPPLRVETAPP